MPHDLNEPGKNKISAEFAARLDNLEADQKVHAIVLLQAQGTGKSAGKRQSHAERQASIEAMRKSAEQALDEIDDILKRFDGHLQANRLDALGAVPVETTAAGISALAESPWVKAIVEDQPIHPFTVS